LSVAQPLAFGRAARMKTVVSELCARTEVENAWQVSLAAMLSQVGCVALSNETLQRMHSGKSFNWEQENEFNRHPEVGKRLVQKIPRLEAIAELIGAQMRPLDSEAADDDKPGMLERANYLHVALQYDRLVMEGYEGVEVVRELEGSPGKYSPEIVSALGEWVEGQAAKMVSQLPISDLKEGMILEKDILERTGAILVQRGQLLSELQVQQLQRRSHTIEQPIHISIQSIPEGELAADASSPVDPPETSADAPSVDDSSVASQSTGSDDAVVDKTS